MILRKKLMIFKCIKLVGIIILCSLLYSGTVNADSDTPSVWMEEGEIVFEITTKAASSDNSIRYRTTGFTISLSPQFNTVTAKGISGPDAPPYPNKQLSFDDKIEVNRTEDYVKTQFKVSKEKVKAAIIEIAGLDLDRISDITCVYLHGVFETYQIVNGNEIKRKSGLSTWKDIVNAEDWVDPTIFNRYFNIEVVFQPGLQNNDLYFEYGGSRILQSHLASLVIGEKVEWKDYVTPSIIENNITYNLTGYYARGKEDSPGTPDRVRKMVGDTVGGKQITVTDIINDSVTVLYGGMDIYMIYERLDIPIKIHAADYDTEQIIKENLYTGAIMPGDEFTQSIPITLTVDNSVYSKTKHFLYYLKNNPSKLRVRQTENDDDPISFTAFSSIEPDDEIIVYAYYRKEAGGEIPGDTDPGGIILRVVMVSQSGALIDEISSENVTPGQLVNKQIQAVRTVRGLGYRYLGKWDYTFITSSGSNTIEGNTNPAAFTVPDDTETGTVVILRLYYGAVQDVEVPDVSPPKILPFDSPNPQGIINGDKYGQPYFSSRDGIPTTESQYVTVRTKEYLLGYRLVNRTGTVAFTVPVSMTYTLQYYEEVQGGSGEAGLITETVTDTQYITVERAYSYWEIDSLEYYMPSTATVYNYSLPEGRVNLILNSNFLSIPSLSTRHSGQIEDHIILPIQATQGIHLVNETPITSDTVGRPEVEYEDLTPYAFELTGELMVKNDYLAFGGATVMTDAPAEKITQAPGAGPMVQSNRMTHDRAFFAEGLVIDAVKENGVYSSSGSITYIRHPMSVNAYDSSRSYSVAVNNVIIHTPVICRALVYTDNDEYVQLVNPTAWACHLVLDPDSALCDFTVSISNTLQHSPRLGYYERDFSRSFIDPENVSYIAEHKDALRNEMRLPFDVYIDVDGDGDASNDRFIKSGTWIVLGRETYRFYVPLWVKEGTYTAEFRTVAVNGTDKLDRTEPAKNLSMDNYVATDTKTFQISGRMYGLTIYDISDEGRWRDVFRVKDSMNIKLFEGAADGTKRTGFHEDYSYYYTVGLKDRYGYQTGRNEKYTLPLINGSHPKYSNAGVLKTGYAFRFFIDTIGDMYGSGCTIRITPTFYHVDEDGGNRQKVDIYYDEEIDGKHRYLVKVGEGIDLINVQYGLAGNPYSRIPVNELMHTANVLGTTYSRLIYGYGPMYSYNEIRITSLFRTFIGTDYSRFVTGMPSFAEVRAQTGETALSLSKYIQRWYGTYKLPSDIHAVPAGYDVKGYLAMHGITYHEDFWLKDGYIIVNFNIESHDASGSRHLSYTNGYNFLNNGHCSMWVMEGGAIEKKDDSGAVFKLMAGDVVFYHTNKKHSDDYIGRGW